MQKLSHYLHKADWSAYHLNGIFGNSGANSNGTVHPGGKFSGKGNTFRGISFFSLLPKFPKISVPFVHSYSARLFTLILPRKNAKDLKLKTVADFQNAYRYNACLCSSVVLADVLKHNCNPAGKNELSFVVDTCVFLLLA